jgi:hypothetical protein
MLAAELLKVQCLYCKEDIFIPGSSNEPWRVWTERRKCHNCEFELEFIYFSNDKDAKCIWMEKLKIRVGRGEKQRWIKRLGVDPLNLDCCYCGRSILIGPIDTRHLGNRTVNKNCAWCDNICTFVIDVQEDKWGIILKRDHPDTRIKKTEPIRYFQCSHIGVAGITDVVVKKHGEDDYEARCGVAIMGDCNFASSHGANPFDSDFHDNHCSGRGKTEQIAIDELKKDMYHLADTLFADIPVEQKDKESK